MQLARLAAVAALGALGLGPAALGACYRDRAPAAPAAAPAADARAATAVSDPLAFLMIDSDVVVGLDARQILRSGLWKHVALQLERRFGGDLAELRQACGFDPLAALRGAAVAMRQGSPVEGVIVLRGLPRDKMMACLAHGVAGRGAARIEGSIATVPGEPPIVMAFAGATTLVIATSRATLDAALSSGAPLRRSPAFSELWSLVDARRAAWFVVNGSSRAFDRLAALGVRPRAVLGSISLAGGLSLTGRLRLGSPDEAAQIASLAQAQAGAAQGMADKLDFGADGSDVTLQLEMTEAQLDTLAGLVLGLWPSQGGGP